MLNLSVRCHQCGRVFRTAVSIGEHGIRGRLLDGAVYECPGCGVKDPYFTAEHFLNDSDSRAVTPGPAADSHPHSSSWLAGLWWVLPAVVIFTIASAHMAPTLARVLAMAI
jgi:hypothetical protein